MYKLGIKKYFKIRFNFISFHFISTGNRQSFRTTWEGGPHCFVFFVVFFCCFFLFYYYSLLYFLRFFILFHQFYILHFSFILLYVMVLVSVSVLVNYKNPAGASLLSCKHQNTVAFMLQMQCGHLLKYLWMRFEWLNQKTFWTLCI